MLRRLFPASHSNSKSYGKGSFIGKNKGHGSQYTHTRSQKPNDRTIQAVPGCWDYDLVRMSTWFARRRQQLRMKERKERGLLHLNNNVNDSRKSESSSWSSPELDIIWTSGFPSLTPAAIQHLTVLANNQHDPSSELLKTWTILLASSGANEQDVINWMHHRNQEQQLHHLPTPSDTTMTPEHSATSPSLSPTFNNFPLYKQETAMSPVMPALQLHPHEREARATPSEPSPTSNNDLMLRLNQCIIHGIRDALASPQTTQNVAP